MQVCWVSNGAGLGGSGDTANIYDGNLASSALLASLEYPSGDHFFTCDYKIFSFLLDLSRFPPL